VSETFQIVRELVRAGKFRLSVHGDEEMREDGIFPNSLLASINTAIVVEDYPTAWKGPSVLLLQEFEGLKFHAIWGLAKATPNVATLITAYVPDPKKWTSDFMRRLKP
jgi:Domain of unknown function (DUF4258)